MIVHFILSGETLESIAEEIQLENPEYLKEYHNQHCAKEDYIFDALVPRKKLLIPDYNKIREYNSRNDAPFKAPELNPELNFNPENFSQIYTVTITETKENEEGKKNNTLSYTVSLKWVRKEGEQHIFQAFRNNFSDQQGSMMADLASECIRSLNPVEIKTNAKGEVLSIGLKQETIDNFSHIKERLSDLFPDQYAKIYIDEFGFSVLNQELFDQRMKEDLLIRTYFAALRNKFTNGKSFFKQTISNENILIEVQQQVNITDASGEIRLKQSSGLPEKDTSYNGNYTLYTDSGLVKEAEITYCISLYGAKYTTGIKIQ